MLEADGMGWVLVGEVGAGGGCWEGIGADGRIWGLGVGRRGLGIVGAYMAHYL